MNPQINILYIDDNPHDQELVLDALEKESTGFKVTLASSREDFELYLKDKKYDVVLSDFNILGYEGLTVLSTVNEYDPSIPVIIVTGTGSEEIAVEAMKRGADDYVIKTNSQIRHLPLMIKTVIEKKILKLQNKKAQEELMKLRKAVDHSGEIIFMTDRKGIFTFINPEFSRIYGYSIEEIIGKCTPRILNGFTTSKEYYNNFWEQLLNGQILKGEFINKTKDGDFLNIEFTINPVYDDNNEINNFLAIQRNITERKKSEEKLQKQYIELEIAKAEAEKADKIKTEFLAQISHEIRTPVNNILNFNSLIREDLFDKVDDDIKYSFEAIERASLRLTRTIDLLLNMSELQTESYFPYFKNINILSVLDQQINEFSLAARKKGLNITTIKSCSESIVFGDEYTIIQIFQNLIDNAIKYTNSGYIEIKVTDDENKLDVVISDTGIGISEHYIPKLFTPFSQEYTGYTRPFDGNGLGLAIVNKYVGINKGEIKINSVKGQGTSVTVSLNKRPFK